MVLSSFHCIPGTIGGGIKMNAGCFRKFKGILISIQAINKSGQVYIHRYKFLNEKVDYQMILFFPVHPLKDLKG